MTDNHVKTSKIARILTVLAMVAVVSVLAGCGSDDSTDDTKSTGSASITGTFNQAAADKVPQAIKDQGTLTVAMDASYAPNEFFDEDGKTIIGTDADLADAIGKTLGLEVDKKNATFDSIIPGLAAGKFDIALSSFTDTKEREQTVDMVTYLTAGTGFYTNADKPTEVTGVADLCGKTVAVQKGTVQQDDVEAQNKKCSEPIDIKVFTQQTDVDLAISSGRAEVALADSPVAAYAVKQSDGSLKSTGKDYDSAPYGIAINKKTELTPAIQAAVQELIDNGTYAAILKKWGLESGAITESKINDGVE
ncbi:MAG: ABC transporter substrate-binding protein [Thermoleophilaceae bacterium]|nr:ABC transporter substrate-binding protein [Thermoleophilaceae bacterium]